MQPEIGRTYIDLDGNTRQVIAMTPHSVVYYKNGRVIENKMSIYAFMRNCMPLENGKTLDQAFKELDKKICGHHNVREDRFFSAMVYKTCKDCGKNLN